MESPDLQFLLPPDFYHSLWRRLPSNVRSVIAPPKYPPLQLSSRPMNLGMLPADRLALPWYRTIFASIGDVLSPETLPPLELESRPIEVDELVSDLTSHPWWQSLLRNLADRVAPERQPQLALTSDPVHDVLGTHTLLLANWSTIIKGPKVFLPDAPKPSTTTGALKLPVSLPRLDPVEVEFVNVLERDVRRDLRRSRIRQRVWISIAAAQAVFLLVAAFWPR
jgi:hypothetical protein